MDERISSARRAGVLECSTVRPPAELTEMLDRVRAGMTGAWDELLERVHDELGRIAHAELRNESQRDLLQTTALVNECWMRLAGGEEPRFENRGHFFTAAARAMRRILVDEARKRHSAKRGAGGNKVSLTVAAPHALEENRVLQVLEEVEAVDVALERFSAHAAHEEHCKVVELRYFAGLTIEEVGQVLGISPATVKRDWDYARAWLRREILRAS